MKDTCFSLLHHSFSTCWTKRSKILSTRYCQTYIRNLDISYDFREKQVSLKYNDFQRKIPTKKPIRMDKLNINSSF